MWTKRSLQNSFTILMRGDRSSLTFFDLSKEDIHLLILTLNRYSWLLIQVCWWSLCLRSSCLRSSIVGSSVESFKTRKSLSLSLSKNWTICFLSIFSVAKHEMILLWVLSSFPLTEADTTEPTDSGDSKNASQVDTKGVYKRSRITKRKANKSVEQKRNLSFCVTKLTWKVTWDRSEQRKGGLFRNKQTSTQLSLSLTYPFLEKKRPNAY